MRFICNAACTSLKLHLGTSSKSSFNQIDHALQRYVTITPCDRMRDTRLSHTFWSGHHIIHSLITCITNMNAEPLFEHMHHEPVSQACSFLSCQSCIMNMPQSPLMVCIVDMSQITFRSLHYEHAHIKFWAHHKHALHLLTHAPLACLNHTFWSHCVSASITICKYFLVYMYVHVQCMKFQVLCHKVSW